MTSASSEDRPINPRNKYGRAARRIPGEVDSAHSRDSQAKKVELKRREREYKNEETKLDRDMIHFESVKKGKMNEILKDLVSSQMVFFARGLELFSEAYTNLDAIDTNNPVLPPVLEAARATADETERQKRLTQQPQPQPQARMGTTPTRQPYQPATAQLPASGQAFNQRTSPTF